MIPALAKLAPMKWKLIAIGGALVVSHGAVAWYVWDWRDEACESARSKALLRATDEARREERQLFSDSLDIERESLARIQQHLDSTRASLEEVQHGLASIPSCPVARDVVRVLQPSTRSGRSAAAAAGASGASHGGAALTGALPGGEQKKSPDASTAIAVEASELLEVCKRNYEQVCIPNAIQLSGLQRWVRTIIDEYNARASRDD